MRTSGYRSSPHLSIFRADTFSLLLNFIPISFSQLQFCDVISFNRHYGWYWYPGQPSLISKSLEEDLRGLHNVFGKPVLMAEYGSSAVAGRHKVIQ